MTCSSTCSENSSVLKGGNVVSVIKQAKIHDDFNNLLLSTKQRKSTFFEISCIKTRQRLPTVIRLRNIDIPALLVTVLEYFRSLGQQLANSIWQITFLTYQSDHRRYKCCLLCFLNFRILPNFTATSTNQWSFNGNLYKPVKEEISPILKPNLVQGNI